MSKVLTRTAPQRAGGRHQRPDHQFEVGGECLVGRTSSSCRRKRETREEGSAIAFLANHVQIAGRLSLTLASSEASEQRDDEKEHEEPGHGGAEALEGKLERFWKQGG